MPQEEENLSASSVESPVASSEPLDGAKIVQALDTLRLAILPVMDQLRRAMATFMQEVREIPVEDLRDVPWGTGSMDPNRERTTLVLLHQMWIWQGVVQSETSLDVVTALLLENASRYRIVVLDTARRDDAAAQRAIHEVIDGPQASTDADPSASTGP